MSGAAPAVQRPARDVVDYELLFDCVHCGLCLEACPTYVLTRAEMDSPRGRIYLMKALADGALVLDADAARHLDLCLGCRGCETACPSGVRYGALIERAREFVEANHRRALRDRLTRALASLVLPHPARMRALLAPLRLVERLGLRSALRAALPRSLREWLDLVPPARDGSMAGARAGIAAAQAPDASTVVVHHGCVAQVLAPSANRNTERLLARAGYAVARLEHTVCCGALDLHAGNRERARAFVRANVRELIRAGADAIVSAASGCSAAMAEYGELLRDDRELADAARDVSARVSDLSALLLRRPVRAGHGSRTKVTYHDACHLAHALGVREAPRELLRSVPGVELVELAESDLCCGSAGTYNLIERDMARALARRKADNIAATGADYVVLANPGCEFQIAAELRRRGANTRVMHLADFLTMALEGSEPASPTT
jgi:glycolate oxidase iron-sulfur subunit